MHSTTPINSNVEPNNKKKNFTLKELATNFSDQQLLSLLANNPIAQFKLGNYLFEQNKKRAIFWFQQAAKNGDRVAQYNLARILMYGHAVPKDETTAISWYKKAAAQGLAVAQFDLANFYLTGQGVTADAKEAFSLFKQSAAQEHIDAKVALGICYMEGKGTEKNEQEGIRLFNETVETNIKARRLLGVCYEKGIGVKKDQEQAYEWYLSAAQEGDAEAQLLVANRLMQGNGVEEDPALAVEWLEEAAKNNYPDAQYQLAFICREGRWGVEKNLQQAFNWFEYAAKQGHAAAQNSVALCYEKGSGTQQDYEKAFVYFQKSAEQGNVVAEANLAVCFYNGKGVEKNFEKAVYWYHQAAMQGDVDAQCALARCLIRGEGVPANKRDADSWIQKAAAQKNFFAINMQENKISYSIDLIKEQAPVDKIWRISLDRLPCVSQVGPYCGLAAVAAAFNLATIHCGDKRPYPIVYATEIEKKAAGQDINIKEDILLYQLNEMGKKAEIKEESYSAEGAVFDGEILLKLAQHYGIPNCEVVMKEKYTEGEYETAVISALNANKLLVVACDSKFGMPANDKGISAHWVFVPDYWYDDKKRANLVVSHQDIYGIWDLEGVDKSCQQMDIKNPHKKDGDLTKFRHTFFTVPILPPIINEMKSGLSEQSIIRSQYNNC